MVSVGGGVRLTRTIGCWIWAEINRAKINRAKRPFFWPFRFHCTYEVQVLIIEIVGLKKKSIIFSDL